jgi:hypothetical protein
MFKKEELKHIRTEFWESFRKRMEKARSASGRRKNWVNYKSNIRDIYFRMDVTGQEAYFAIDIQFQDEGIREIVWEQFMEAAALMRGLIGEEMECLPDTVLNPGLTVHRLKWTKHNVSLFESSDHEKIQTFLEQKIRGLDEFWTDFFELFYGLCN